MRPEPPRFPHACYSVSSNRDWLPALPPWGSSNKDQLPNLIKTKGCAGRGFLPFRPSVPAAPFAFLLPAGPGSEVRDGRSTSLALEAWREVLPPGPVVTKAAKPEPGLCFRPAAVVPRKGAPPQRPGLSRVFSREMDACSPPASPAPPNPQVPPGRECKINLDTRALPCTPFWGVWERAHPA